LAAHLCSRLSGRDEPLGYPDVLVRDVPEQVVLVEQRHVTVEEVPALDRRDDDAARRRRARPWRSRAW
jgi:hypothetical protein